MGGLIQSMYFLGQILTVAILFLCLHMLGNALGWRTGYVIVGVVSLLVGIAAFAVLPESTAWLTYQRQFANGTIQIEKRRSKIPLIDIFRSQYATGTILFMLLSTAMFLTTNSVGVYVSTFLIKIQHMALGTASLIVLLGYGCTMIAYTVTGIASDYIRRKWAFVGACLFGTAGFTFFLILVLTKNDHVSSNFWASPTFWALMWCAAASGGFGVLGVWMSEFFPTRIRSTGSNASYYAGRGLGAGVFPLFALTLAGGSIAGALSLGIAGPVAGTILAALAKDRTSGRVIVAIE
jgi:predicted MFS family arabinose efflux permease